jgi:hypothetical protein
MPGLAPSVKNQSRTTGLNMEFWMGRTSTTLKEYDVKRCDISDNDSVQDKTGSFGNGWEDAEMGVRRFDVDIEFINRVADPIGIADGNHVWYFKRIVKGGKIHEGYVLWTVNNDNTAANADHVITARGRSVVREEGGVMKYPNVTTWVAS